MKPFLVLQLRPETEAADNEFEAILKKSGLDASRVHRIRLDREELPENLDLEDYAGTIVGGGPGCVSDAEEDKSELERSMEKAVYGLMPEIVGRDLPFLGCCYGIGILAAYLGARVGRERYSEPVSVVRCNLTEEGRADPITKDLPDEFDVYVGHKEAVQELPEGCAHLMSSADCPFHMIRFGDNVYATQFHPESDADTFDVRIRIYRDMGYFDPADAGRISAACHKGDATDMAKVLKNFVSRYG